MRKMNKPKSYTEWAEEALAAFKDEYKILNDGKSSVKDKYNLFRVAPIAASINRGINSTDRGSEMLSIVKDIENDFEIDEEAKEQYLFNFVFAYIHSHIYADLLEELEADRIMDYINDNYQLFESA